MSFIFLCTFSIVLYLRIIPAHSTVHTMICIRSANHKLAFSPITRSLLLLIFKRRTIRISQVSILFALRTYIYSAYVSTHYFTSACMALLDVLNQRSKGCCLSIFHQSVCRYSNAAFSPQPPLCIQTNISQDNYGRSILFAPVCPGLTE